MTRIIDVNMGKVATSPSNDNNGQYSDLITYKRYEMVLHDYDAWVSKKDSNKGHTPVDGSQWWFRATNGGKYARQVADAAVADAETATAGAENVDANLNGMTVTITNRQGESRHVNIGFEIAPENVYASKAAMIADAANILAGKFCMIATTDPTATDNATLWSRNTQPASAGANAFTFLSDLDQASSAAFADWLENYKPTIEADHTRAETDHSTATTDHATAGADHTQAGQDHTLAQSDHQTASSDHNTAEADHDIAATDHTTASADHTQALGDHQTAESDHTTASSDHTQAESDTSRASTDHQTATSDHSTAESDHSQAESDHNASVTATNAATTEANRAKDYNDHPWDIGEDGFIYVWDETTQQMVRTNKMIIDFNDLTEEQKQELIDEFYETLTFASVETCESIIDELK